ncbi:MAG TPA: PilT/PilU family type 4a pilus ATPase [Polyangiaceae bacterium]|nr:PilT/PilU family type 4a pilus ATPase [Polyangiaceae bacterium]
MADLTPPSLPALLRWMIEKNASDLHLAPGAPPLLRVDGGLVPLPGPPLDADQSRSLCYATLTDEQRARFERERELAFVFPLRSVARFRGVLTQQRGAVAGSFRAIPLRILTVEELGLPPVVAELALRPRGLVVVAGPVGSGKSTTAAALVDKINASARQHVMTLEDPVEFLHPPKLCLVSQRDLGADARSMREAAKHAARQDVDVVLVGESRDAESVEGGLALAEAGRLVLTTVNALSCAHALERLVSLLPAREHARARARLAAVVQGVVSQQLLPRLGAPGRALALEVLSPSATVRSLVRDDKLTQLHSYMQSGPPGVQTMNQSLALLASRGVIAYDDAFAHSNDPEELRALLENRSPPAQPTPAHHRPYAGG